MTYAPQAVERLLLYLVLTGEPWCYRSQDLDCFSTEELRLMVEVAKQQRDGRVFGNGRCCLGDAGHSRTPDRGEEGQ